MLNIQVLYYSVSKIFFWNKGYVTLQIYFVNIISYNDYNFHIMVKGNPLTDKRVWNKIDENKENHLPWCWNTEHYGRLYDENHGGWNCQLFCKFHTLYYLDHKYMFMEILILSKLFELVYELMIEQVKYGRNVFINMILWYIHSFIEVFYYNSPVLQTTAGNGKLDLVQKIYTI